ncbi:MAG: photosystem I reaction center subunit XII [Candidatus Cloacimonetes bacterium]|nr:photosystem I reaction center subunit XII [Candidatus Cloacimonadota bacterium]
MGNVAEVSYARSHHDKVQNPSHSDHRLLQLPAQIVALLFALHLPAILPFRLSSRLYRNVSFELPLALLLHSSFQPLLLQIPSLSLGLALLLHTRVLLSLSFSSTYHQWNFRI